MVTVTATVQAFEGGVRILGPGAGFESKLAFSKMKSLEGMAGEQALGAVACQIL
jgi:hypothetical protein